MAWLVTEPDEFAIGFAVALTPPTSAARAIPGDKMQSSIILATDFFVPFTG